MAKKGAEELVLFFIGHAVGSMDLNAKDSRAADYAMME